MRYEILTEINNYEGSVTSGIIETYTIAATGSGYNVGDIVTLDGGSSLAQFEITSVIASAGTGLTIQVLNLNGVGGITGSAVVSPGSGYAVDDLLNIVGATTPCPIRVFSLGGGGSVAGFSYTSNIDRGSGFTVSNIYSTTAVSGRVTAVTLTDSGMGYTEGTTYDTTTVTGSGSGLRITVDTVRSIRVQELDVYEEEPFPLNFVISDIKTIDSKNSSYSNTIKMPDTSNNRNVFGYIFNITSDSTFDARLKSKVWVIQDLKTVFEGYLQLVSINYDYNTGNNYYEVLLFAEVDTLFQRLGEKTLNDLTSLDGSYNHKWNATNIINSINSDVNNGYVYPLIDYSYNLQYSTGLTPSFLKVKNLYPAWYLKPILKAIITEADFTVESSFLESDLFNHLIIPFSNKKIIPVIYDTLGITASNYTLQVRRTGSGDLSSIDIDSGGSYSVDHKWNSMMFNNEIYDQNDFYYGLTATSVAGGTYSYIHNIDQTYSHRFRIDLNILYDAAGAAASSDGYFWTTDDDDIRIILKRGKQPLTGATVSGFSNDPSFRNLSYDRRGTDINEWPYIPFNGNPYVGLRSLIQAGILTHTAVTGSFVNYGRITGTIYSDWLDGLGNDFTLPLYENEPVKFFYMRSGFTGSTVDVRINPATTLWNQIDTSAPVVGCDIAVSDNLPNNVKQRDLLATVFNMFNLYAEPIKNVTDAIRLETHDTFFTTDRTIKDWTDKLDLSEPIISQITSDLQAKNLKFTYKEDKDRYNNDYTADTKHIYGDYVYTYENEFTTDTTEITPIFSGTPIDLMPGSNEIHLPVIETTGTNGDASKYDGFNIRLLYYNKKNLTTDLFRFEGITYSYYPYCGPFDDPNNPDVSLNFGQVVPFQSSVFNETVHNIFYDYWQNTVLELGDKNSRLLTLKLYLNANDISNFRFNDLIFLTIDGKDGYYRVNKIENYDPLYPSSTKVELLTALYYDIPVNTLPYLVDDSAPTSIALTVGRSRGNLSTSRNAVTVGSNILSVGNDTLAYGNNIVALGSTNVLSGANIYSAGENNTLSGDNIINFGSNNVISSTDTIVFGSGITSAEAGSMVIGYQTVFNYPVTFMGTVSGLGAIGATGPQGATGSQGPQGFAGVTGSQGPQGFQGISGVGFTGSIGPQGFTGATGSQGQQGFQGPQGFQGFSGPAGATGSDGITTVTGTSSFLLGGFATSSTAGIGNGAGSFVDMATFTIPANTLATDGDAYRLVLFLKAGGLGSTTTVELVINFGGTVDYTWLLTVPASSANGYKIEIETVRINNDGFGYMANLFDTTPYYYYGSTTTFTNYFSSNRTLTLRGIDNAGTTANIVKYVGGYLLFMNKP
jgi:hypothetical protein